MPPPPRRRRAVAGHKNPGQAADHPQARSTMTTLTNIPDPVAAADSNNNNNGVVKKSESEEEKGAALGANLDLVREILLRLPAASILRFKVVCKEWHRVLSDPSFVAAHSRRRRRPRMTGVLMCDFSWSSSTSFSTVDGSRVFPEISSPYSFSPCYYMDYMDSCHNMDCVFRGVIFDSCNGLLVGKDYRMTKKRKNKVVLVVYNPTTLQRRILPKAPWWEEEDYPYFAVMVLAFDPCRSLNYRVVVFCDHPHFIISVYRSETNCWDTLFTKGEAPWIPSLDRESINNRCFCNGLVHWFTRDGFVVTIDVDKRIVRTTTTTCLPAFTLINQKKYYISYCGQSRGGRFRVIRSNTRPASTDFNPLDPAAELQVLELADDDQWLLLHTIQITDLYSEICKLKWDSPVTSRRFISSMSSGISWFCCLVDGGEEEEEEEEEEDDINMVLIVENKIMAYDLRSRTLRVLCDNHERRRGKLIPCTNTIAPP